jgi:predicted phage tail component-like protein
MATNGFTFNGVHSSKYFIVNKIERPIIPLITPRLLVIPKKKGAYDQGIDTGVSSFNHIVTLLADTLTEFEKVKKEIASWLITEELAPLVYDSDPNVTHYVRFSGKLALEEMYIYGDSGTVTFVSPDPHGYGAEATISVPQEGLIFINEGTAETFPKFKATVNQPITFLDIVTPDDYIRIGEPVAVDSQAPFEKKVTILKDELTSTTGWANGSTVDGGIVTGTMASDGNNFVASDYGTGTEWHGPALKQSLSEQLTDYRIELAVDFRQFGPDTVGRAELYMLDVNGVVIGKLGIKDVWANTINAFGEIRLGDLANGKYIYAGSSSWWNDFDGLLMLQKEGNRFSCFITEVDRKTGQHYSIRHARYVDVDGKFSAKLAAIQLHIGGYGTRNTFNPKIKSVNVIKINSETENQVPYIAKAGDILEFDHSKALILKNGEPFLDEKDFASNFFSLGKGETEILVRPNDVADVEMTYRPRWLG